MLDVTVTFESVEVIEFSLKSNPLIKISFNDGSSNSAKFKVPLNDLEHESHSILRALRQQIKENNRGGEWGDNPLDNIVNVVFKNEEQIEERLKGFLRKLSEKKKQLSGTSMHSGYIDSVTQAKYLKMYFNHQS